MGRPFKFTHLYVRCRLRSTLRINNQMVDFVSPAFGEASKSITADVYISAKRWVASLDPSDQKLDDYRDGLLSSLGHIQIMGMASARKLESVYVGLRAISNIKKLTNRIRIQEDDRTQKIMATAQQFIAGRQQVDIDKFLIEHGYDRIVEDYRSQELPDPETAETLRSLATAVAPHGLQAIKLIDQNSRTVILGHPGSGKTTFLKYLALAYSGHLPIHSGAEPLLPIFVPLRELKRAGDPHPTAEWLQKLAISCAQDISTKIFSKEWLEAALQKGKCIILLDGIDEVPAKAVDTIIQSIKSFSTRYRKNKIVVTCRVASFDRSLDGFQVCEIDEFNDEDIHAFLHQWFGANSKDASRIEADIKASHLARDLCKTPLLLTLICILYGYRRSIPENRSELYEACVDALLFRWDTFRAIDRDPILEDTISPERKKLLLSRLAAKTFARNVVYFKRDFLLSMIRSELDSGNFGGISEVDFLKEIESHNGLLTEHAISIYCFSHLTFHEFFVSLYYYDTKEFADLFQKTVKTGRYNEIFLMALEKAYNADSFVMPLISHASNEIESVGTLNGSMLQLLAGVLASNASINPKLKQAMRELLIGIAIEDAIEVAESRDIGEGGDDILDFEDPNEIPG